MKFFFDTEFIEDGRTIDLISIGIVAEDGRTYYAESKEFDANAADPWVRENVFTKLSWSGMKSRADIAAEVQHFVSEYPITKGPTKPQFWAYYADYDWVVLCQLYGRMINLPKGWPMYCRDVKQLCDMVGNPKLPPQPAHSHNALADAIWTREAWEFLQGYET